MLNTSDMPGMEEVTAADGRVCGMALINGRMVAVEAQDNTILGGSGGHVCHRKVEQLVRMATERGYPIVRLMDGVGGARSLLASRRRLVGAKGQSATRGDCTWVRYPPPPPDQTA